MLCGCSVFKAKAPVIQAAGVTVQGPADAGKPATLETLNTGVTVPLPAGSKIVVTETEAIPATPEAPAKPAVTVTEITPGGVTEIRKTEASVKADTGTVDTSVAKAKIQAEESRVLLYAALGAAALAALFVWLQYPTPALISGAAAVVFFLAWRVSGLPSWFWGLGVAVIALAGGLYFGFERAEKPKKP